MTGGLSCSSVKTPSVGFPRCIVRNHRLICGVNLGTSAIAGLGLASQRPAKFCPHVQNLTCPSTAVHQLTDRWVWLGGNGLADQIWPPGKPVLAHGPQVPHPCTKRKLSQLQEWLHRLSCSFWLCASSSSVNVKKIMARLSFSAPTGVPHVLS